MSSLRCTDLALDAILKLAGVHSGSEALEDSYTSHFSPLLYRILTTSRCGNYMNNNRFQRSIVGPDALCLHFVVFNC